MPEPTVIAAPPAAAGAARAPSSLRSFAILGIAGANLTLIQFVAMREFASLLGSNELVALLVAAGYFLGLSAGYVFSDRLSRGALVALGGATLALHVTLPFSARWLVGFLVSHGSGAFVPPFVFVLTFAGITPFYAVFLPRLVAEFPTGDGTAALVRCYAAELAGGALGLALVLVVTPGRMALLLTLHLGGLLALLLIFARARPTGWLLFVLPPMYFAAWPALDRASLESYFARVHRLRDPVVLASEFSPYQRVDLLRVETARGPAPYLYLNGNLLYGTRALNQHNLLVTLLPRFAAGAVHGGAPLHTLVVAGGSLDCARYLAPLPGRLHVVEIDATVTRLTRALIQEPRGGFPTNWDLTIDDGKHFLGAWAGEPFDAIAVDIPVPTHLQTALLHSERFFALARSRLRAGGVFSVSLAGRLSAQVPGDSAVSGQLAHRIVAGLRATFPHVAVVRGEFVDFAWASDRPLDALVAAAPGELDRFLAADETRPRTFGTPRRLQFIAEDVVARRADGFAPIGEADLQLVLRLSWRKLQRRFFATAEEEP
ncbi:MAG: hypothetical protein HYV96_19205 [Opitutae bacterium]|nr:hypothetical protein [Opitutae bacterium]